MSPAPRLTSIDAVADGVRRPGYDPAALGAGIVHIGPGAFHRAHQAVYTDDALAAHKGDWRITGISLRSTETADALNDQNGLYTLLERDAAGPRARIIASIGNVIAAARDRRGALDALCGPATRIVSLTITEKAYGIDRKAGGVDLEHTAIAADLADPTNPSGAIGLIVESLRLRRAAGLAAYTVLCCDNLPENGSLVKAGLLDFAARRDAGLRDWIDTHCTFPSTMVDRITPAPTEATRAGAARLTGCDDHAAVETEPFTQWVVEEGFAAGRPPWEAGGALFVTSVAPYEHMKLRMLNGAHSMLAYAGFLSGHTHVRDVMAAPDLAALVERHLDAAAATLEPLDGIDFAHYGRSLRERFQNPAIAHETYQIAMDGTAKLPQRIFAPALDALRHGHDLRPFAFATAAWMRYALARKDDGEAYALRDPREDEIGRVLAGARDPDAIAAALHDLPGLVPDKLSADTRWRETVGTLLGTMMHKGMAVAIRDEAQQAH